MNALFEKHIILILNQVVWHHFMLISAHPLYFPQIPSSMPAVTGPCWFSPSLSSFPSQLLPAEALWWGSCMYNSKLRTEKDNGNSENYKAKRNCGTVTFLYIMRVRKQFLLLYNIKIGQDEDQFRMERESFLIYKLVFPFAVLTQVLKNECSWWDEGSSPSRIHLLFPLPLLTWSQEVALSC